MTRSRNQSDQVDSSSAKPTESDYHRLLSAQRRRIALKILADRSPPVDLDELGVAVAKREDGLRASDDEQVERVLTTLHHVHLPMMADVELIDYDHHDSRVTSCPSGDDALWQAVDQPR